jgi:hypothetical protein
MIKRIRYIWQLLILASLLVVLGILLIPRITSAFSLPLFLTTVLVMAVINLVAYLIMETGSRKNNREGMVILLGGLGLKFLLYLLYILVVWLVTKNLSKPFIIAFFVLYLVFTFLLAGNLLKTLKNK